MTEDAKNQIILPGRIVVVAGEERVRKHTRQALEATEQQDIVLVTCSTGQELLSRFRELQPDVLILDPVLGDMDGPALLESLSGISEGYTTPVIFLTGKSRLIMVEDYKHLGVIGVIHKPFDLAALPGEVAAMWKAHQMDKGIVLE